MALLGAFERDNKGDQKEVGPNSEEVEQFWPLRAFKSLIRP